MSKVFAEGGVEIEYMAESGLLISFGGKRNYGDKKFAVSKVFLRVTLENSTWQIRAP